MRETRGCAFLCDGAGVIINVLRDDFNLKDNTYQGKLFSTLIIPKKRQQALDLVYNAKRNNLALDYILDIEHEKRHKSLYFIGVHLSGQVLIVGAENQKEAIEFTDHLQQINNEQTNYIRSLLKERADYFSNQENESSQLFDELSQVNNELVNLQRELSKKNIELERLNEIKNHFLGMAAHDLRNPLGIIQNYAEFLEEEQTTLSEEQLFFISHIKDLSAFMLNLVNELLDVSAIESGNIDLNSEETDIVNVVNHNIQINKTLAEKKNITLEFKPCCESLILFIDQVKIEQVISNLLTNAVKFSKPKTKISVTIYEEGNEIIIKVKDQGQGISANEIDKLFRPFQRTSTRTTGGEKSTGLGLYISKRIIEAHHGNIWVESELNKGSVFYFSLPKSRQDE
jgi:two-component system, OmpR family, sensor kinase